MPGVIVFFLAEPAFDFCTLLENVSVPSSVTTIDEHAFEDCKAITEFELNPENTSFIIDSYGVLYTSDMTTVLRCPMGNKEHTSYEIAFRAADCNHDEIIDGQDVWILNEAGALLASVSQSGLREDEMEAWSAYAEYIGLIDQTPENENEIETEEETKQETEDDTTFPESNENIKSDESPEVTDWLSSLFD